MKKIVLMVLFLFDISFSQYGAMWYNNYARSISSFALGEQGVASKNGIDGLVYNPANLIHTAGTQFTFFRNPLYYTGFDGSSIKSYAAAYQYPGDFYIGSELMSWDSFYPEPVLENSISVGKEAHYFNRTVALSFAQKISNEFGYGVQLRYSTDRYNSESIEHFFGSAGLQYIPESFQENLRIGFSLMNFSTPLQYTSIPSLGPPIVTNDAPSSYVRFGFEYDVANHELFRTTLHSEVSKEIHKFVNNEGQSSFHSLYNDWDDFPDDVTLHSGISMIFNPIPLGNNITFIQEVYTGYLGGGPKAGYRTMFYNGFNIGLGFYGFEMMAGYAGLWHIVNDGVYSVFRNDMPWETFQITLRNSSLNFLSYEQDDQDQLVEKIIITAGAGYTKRIGRFAEQKVYGPSSEYYVTHYADAPSYSIESAFYLSRHSALVANIRYGKLPLNYSIYASLFGFSPALFTINLQIETLTLTSAYRYHPIPQIESIFFEAGFGIQRQNPIEHTLPKYKYNTVALINIGLLQSYQQIVIMPKLHFTTLLERITGTAPRLGGYNQFEFSLSMGYQFE